MPARRPRPFDLCLELKGRDRSFRFYSHHDWVIRPGQRGAELPEEIAWLSPTLRVAQAMSDWEAKLDDLMAAEPPPGAPDDMDRVLNHIIGADPP